MENKERNTNEKPINENVHTYDNGFHPKEVKLKEDYKLYRRGIFFRIGRKLLIAFFVVVLWFAKTFVWGYKVKGKKNLKKIKGGVILCNHTHQLDAFMICTSLFFKSIYITMLESNLGFGFVSGIFRLGGAVPIPTERNLFKRFNKETPEIIKKGHFVLVYPEAALMPYCDHIRPFMSGAFHIAMNADCVIIPTVMTFHKPRGLYKLTRRKKPCMHYNILPPYYPKDMGNKRLTMDTAMNEINKIMSDYFIENSDYYYENGCKK